MILTKELFKQLAEPLCKNKNKKPKKYSNNYYEHFEKYIIVNNIENVINTENFKRYFLDFCKIHFEDENGIRLEFSDKTKLDLLKRSGGCCAICGTLTIFPMENNKSEALSIGAACHIMPASEYGPRSDIEYRNKNPEKICSIENGLWACLNCHKEIDNNHTMYTITKLKDIKEIHELKMLKLKESKMDIKKLIDNFEKFSNPDYIYIKRDSYEEHQKEFFNMYKTLKNIEKEASENITVYDLYKKMQKLKKSTNIKNENIQIDMTKDNFKCSVTNGNIDDAYNLIMETHNDKEVTQVGLRSEKTVKDIQRYLYNYDNDLELFVVNEKENTVIKVIDHRFKMTFYSEEKIILENSIFLRLEIIKDDYIDFDYRCDNQEYRLEISDYNKFYKFLICINFDFFLIGTAYLIIRIREKVIKLYIGGIMTLP